ncbi:hypothetical protein SAMN04487943_10551 [Gracilibacillus orientalis]|uniref:Yip1 domain-containing protein n=1 Tax=Gracilibacillus orientalis TaxID=334253 RepID=A0A1I4LIP4_9BACI|nr:hypothetical protein [Gracilibacillus orientalis]SFL90978.1 hypothetical protein SAMN04487943_10551 [Gracilibacillus orientalis]
MENGNNLEEENVVENSETKASNEESGEEKKKSSTNFDFGESMKETKGILKEAILRPHNIVSSNRSIKLETSVLILLFLSFLIGICSFIFYKYAFDGMLSFLEDVGFLFILSTIFSWIITFAIGYLSVYLLLMYFGNRKMEHKELLTKYAIVNIPFALVFCLVILLFGFLMIDLFVITYVFALMLYGMLHIYLYLVNMDKPKLDLYWTMTVYLLFLIVVTYLLNGLDFTSF